MELDFYDVKSRTKVSIPRDQVTKYRIVKRNKSGAEQIRFAVKAEHKGSTITRFVSRQDFESLNVPAEPDKT